MTPTNMADVQVRSVAEEIARDLGAAGVDVLLDDRDERPGVKFKDADLVGVPCRINVGKGVAEETVELFTRRGGMKEDVRRDEVCAIVQQRFASPARSSS